MIHAVHVLKVDSLGQHLNFVSVFKQFIGGLEVKHRNLRFATDYLPHPDSALNPDSLQHFKLRFDLRFVLPTKRVDVDAQIKPHVLFKRIVGSSDLRSITRQLLLAEDKLTFRLTLTTSLTLYWSLKVISRLSELPEGIRHCRTTKPCELFKDWAAFSFLGGNCIFYSLSNTNTFCLRSGS